jgi:hypothetical protein
MDAPPHWALLAQLLAANPYAPAGHRHPLATCAGWVLHLDAATRAPRYEREGAHELTSTPPPEWDDAAAVVPPLVTLACAWRGAHQAWEVHRDGATLTQYFVRVAGEGDDDGDDVAHACSWAPPPALVAADLLRECEGALIAWEADVAYSYALQEQEGCGVEEGDAAGCADAAGGTATDDDNAEAVAAYLHDTQRVRAAVQTATSPSPDDAGACATNEQPPPPATLLARVRGEWEVWEAGPGHPTAAGFLYYFHRPSGACSWLVPGDVTAAGDDEWEVVVAATASPSVTAAACTTQLPSTQVDGADSSGSSWRQRRAERKAAQHEAAPVVAVDATLVSSTAPATSGEGAPSETRRARRRRVAPIEPTPTSGATAAGDPSVAAPHGSMDVASQLRPLDDVTCAQPLPPAAVAAAVASALSLPAPTVPHMTTITSRRRSSADDTLLSVVRAVEAATAAAVTPASEAAAAAPATAQALLLSALVATPIAAAAPTCVSTLIDEPLPPVPDVPAWLAAAPHAPAPLPSPPPVARAADGGVDAGLDGDASWRYGLGLGLGHAFGKGAVVSTRRYGDAATAPPPPPPPPRQHPEPSGSSGSEQPEAAPAAAANADEGAVRRTLARVVSLRREHAVEAPSPTHGADAVADASSLRSVREVAWIDHHLYEAADAGDVASLAQLAAAVGTSPASLADEIARWTRCRERALAAGGGGGRLAGRAACTAAGGFSMSLWARWRAGLVAAPPGGQPLSPAAGDEDSTAAIAAASLPLLQTALQAWEAAERERLKGARARLSASHDAELERRRLAAAVERARRHAGVSAAVGGVAAAKAATGEATRAALAAARAQALTARDAALAASKARVARMRG